MPPVRVQLIEKQRLDNHRPEFRPTDSDKLYGSERTIASVVNRIAADIPQLLIIDFIAGRISEQRFYQRVAEASREQADRLERAIYRGFQAGQLDGVEQARRDVNARLRELGSDVRLRSRTEMTKAIASVLWDVSETTFARSDPQGAERIYSRFRTSEILTDLTRDSVASIEVILGRAFTESQTFSSGATVTGLTPANRSSAIYAVLNDITGVPQTGADVATRVAPHTRGLFPRWALAVDRTGNAAAYEVIRAGGTPAQALAAAERQMARHGEKLRRARSRMIARTEISAAQNAGIQQQHDRMIAEGVVAPDAKKRWITGPYDVCNICVPLGASAPIPADEDFFWASGSGNPPAHPNCRCKTRLLPSIRRAPERIGDGTPEDPFRFQFESGWEAGIAPVRGTSRRPQPAATVTPDAPRTARSRAARHTDQNEAAFQAASQRGREIIGEPFTDGFTDLRDWQDGFSEMNARARRGDIDPVLARMNEKANSSLGRNVQVYRGLAGETAEQVAGAPIGATVRVGEAAEEVVFSSTWPEYAAGFTRGADRPVMFEIKARSGLAVPDEYSAINPEHAVLLPGNVEYRVMGQRTETIARRFGGDIEDVRIVELEEIRKS